MGAHSLIGQLQEPHEEDGQVGILENLDPGRAFSVFLFGIPFARDHGGPETEPFQFLGEYRHGQFGGIMKGADNEDGMRLFFRCIEEAA